jgi:cytochrome oxidase Cu insertion factor (SCO1/SenC/PrrC family)
MGKKLTYSFVTFSVLIFLLFILLISTWGFIRYVRVSTHHTINTKKNGFFLNPITPVAALSFKTITGQPFDPTPLRGKWVVLYFNNTPCNNHYCDHYLNTLVTVEQAFNKKPTTLVSAWLKNTSAKNLANPDHKQLKLINIDNTNLNPNRFYVIDPLGNLILSYKPDVLPQVILSDLQRLMRVSDMSYQIGARTI